MKNTTRYGVLLSFAILLFTIEVFAQKSPISIGVRGGISIPNLSSRSDNPVSRGYSSKLGLDVAVYAEFPLTPTFSLEPALQYSEQGGKKNGRQAFPVPAFEEITGSPTIYADVKSKASLNYLMLPLLAKWGWDFGGLPPSNDSSQQNHFRVYVQVGPFLGYMMSAHQKLSNTKTGIYLSDDDDAENILGEGVTLDFADFTNTNINTYDDLHSFNVGFIGGVGLAYHFGKNAIFVEGGGSYGLLNVQKDTENNGKNNTGAAYVGLGFSCDL